MPSPRLIAIGDIHGCISALDAVLDAIEPRADDQLVCLGDFIDQGRESAAVIQRLIDLQSECQLVTLQGNHEELLLASLTSGEARATWEHCGGVATLNSYRFGADLSDIPEHHIQFVRSCRDYLETDKHLFVHANYEPDLPPEEWPDYTLRWSLLEGEPRPHMSGKTVVVGHTEQRSGEILDLGHVKCIDTACHAYGWLTALDVLSGQVWQASRWGVMRESPSDPKPEPLPPG